MPKSSVTRRKAKPSRSELAGRRADFHAVTFQQQRQAVEKMRRIGMQSQAPASLLVAATPGETVNNSIEILEALRVCIDSGANPKKVQLLLSSAIDALFHAENDLHYYGQEAGILAKRRERDEQEARS